MKKITRTIESISGIEIVPNFATMTFDEKPFTVYDESDVPQNVKNVRRESRLYTVSVEEFLKVAIAEKEGADND